VTRQSTKQINIDPNVRVLRVYPIDGSKKQIGDLKTVGIKLSREQAVHLARVLLAAAQDWDEIDITAYRGQGRQSDGTNQLTVTSMRPEDDDD
jgi:hypothetical protein